MNTRLTNFETGIDASQIVLRRQDADDLNRELAGLDVGRIKRFGVSDSAPGARDEKSRKEREKDARLAWLMMLATQEQIAQLSRNVDDLQEKLDAAFVRLEEDLTDLEARTARLDDGRAVYRTEDGMFRTVDGTVFDVAQVADIPANAASWEERQALQERRVQLSRIQTDVIDDARERIDQGGLTNGDLEDINGKIEDAESQIDDPTVSIENDKPMVPMGEAALFQNVPSF